MRSAGQWALLCCFSGVLAAGTASCGKVTTPTDAPGTSPTNEVSTNTTGSAAVYDKLLGQWQRPDGGYVLEFKTIDAAGQIQAAYFNPSPIHVSKALAISEGSELKVFVELNDRNYPGCTYSLKFDPKFDQLYGEYFQAAMGERFSVTFAHLKPEQTQ
jgi:hypothetical protein